MGVDARQAEVLPAVMDDGDVGEQRGAPTEAPGQRVGDDDRRGTGGGDGSVGRLGLAVVVEERAADARLCVEQAVECEAAAGLVLAASHGLDLDAQHLGLVGPGGVGPGGEVGVLVRWEEPQEHLEFAVGVAGEPAPVGPWPPGGIEAQEFRVDVGNRVGAEGGHEPAGPGGAAEELGEVVGPAAIPAEPEVGGGVLDDGRAGEDSGVGDDRSGGVGAA